MWTSREILLRLDAGDFEHLIPNLYSHIVIDTPYVLAIIKMRVVSSVGRASDF